MQHRIYRSLLLMGTISVIITFIVAGVLHYQNLQEQVTHELGNLTMAISGGISQDEKDRSISYLSKVYDENNREIQILWLDRSGQVLYDSQGNTNDGNFLSAEDVQEAEANGQGHAVLKDSQDTPKNYFSALAPDGTILRVSRERVLPFKQYEGILPEILIFVVVFLVGCFAAAEAETQRILQPLRKLGELVQRIIEGEKVDEIPGDYTELKPAIDKLKEQHADIENYIEDIENERNTIRAVLNTISDGIILLDSHKMILDYNKKTGEIFNPSEDKRFRHIASLYHDESFLRAVGRAFHTEKPKDYTMTLSGHPFNVLMTPLTLSDEEHGLLIVLRDMTSEHAAEKMRREFTSNVTHELKTPLTSISGFAEMIANGMCQNPDDVKKFGSRIFDESQRMLSLIDTILHLSKIEETETTISWNVIAVDSLVRYAVDLMQNQAAKKNIKIEASVEPLYMYGNAALISELVVNLLDNALKYNHDGGLVKVALKKQGDDQMLLTVSDNGIGIPKDKQQRVFERFYRVDESRDKKTGGSGLGLAICKHIVLRHKGRMEIASEEGKGTTVSVFLPRLTGEELEKERQAAMTAQQEAADAESGRLAAQEAAEDQEKAENEEKVDKKDKLSLNHKKPDKDKLKKEKKNKKSKKKKEKDKEKEKVKDKEKEKDKDKDKKA